MHRSIAGLADAFQSIADAKATLNARDKNVLKTVSRDLAAADTDFESNRRINDASQHYLDMENCTARISAKLRAMDDLDLNLHKTADEGDVEDDDADLRVSNQKRFIDDQCHRAQALLSGEYYLRNLHSNEVHKDIMELDERIGYAAKNWKHALIELGINEADLTDLKAPAVEAAQETVTVKSDSRKVRRNTVITPKGAAKADVSMVAVEAEYHGYNVAEFNELNEILTQFMDHAFLNGTNGYELSNEIMARCARFKNKIIALTNQLIETEKRTVKTAIREAQRKVRLLETDLALLHAQHEEADMVMRNQKDADKVIRRLVEEKFKESLNQLNEHHKRIDYKIEAQLETNNVLQKRIAEVHAMFLELQKQRLYADPFVRRRAENIVKGLLANLNEKDLKEQELREQEMSASYQQWKKIMEFCNEKERQLALMQSQEQSLQEEIANQKQRIAKERVIYRDRVKVLKSKDDEQSNRLRVLEEKLSDKARDERRKLHFEQRSEAMKQPMHANANASHAMTNIPEGRAAGGGKSGGRRPQSRASRSGNNSDSDGSDDDGESQQQGKNAVGGNNKASDDADTSESGETESSSDSSRESDVADDSLGQPNTASKHVKSKRIKQHGVRTVAPLCDDYTEVLLGITHEHTKRQEISRTVFTHIPRPAAGHITGSEQSDNALLAKAQKMMSTLHSAAEAQEDPSNAAAGNQSQSSTAVVPVVPRESEPAWATQTNSSAKPVVKFGGSARGQSVSGKVQYGFWADADPLDGELDDSSSEDGFRGPSAGGTVGTIGAGGGERKQKAVQVHSLTSTACYVALYYRYLKKFPNLNFKKDNPRLQSPIRHTAPTPFSPVEGKGGTGGPPSSRGAEVPTAAPPPPPSELISKNNRFQFTIKEGLVVVKEALDALLQCKVVDKIILTDALAKMSELERRVKLAFLPEEEKEVRYQLHYMCISLIHTVLSRAPRVLLVKNNRKYFVEICSCMLALLGVVLNCSLVFWQPSCLTKSSKMHAQTAAGGVVMDRVEFICAHLIELVITLGDVDSARPLSGDRDATATGATPAIPEHSTRTSIKRSGKNFKVKKQADTPPGPAGFICLLRRQTAELLLRKKSDEKSGSVGSPADASSKEAAGKSAPAIQRPGSTIPSTNRGIGVSYHDLFEMFNKIVDDDTPIEGVANEVGTFTMKHRHAILSLQLFLYLSLNNKETPMNEAILMLHKGIMDGAASVRADESNVIPCDVDILLQQMHPGMVPAVLTLELIRRVLEAEFERVAFLRKIAEAHHDVADLQFLNVEFAGQFDVSIKTNRELSNKDSGKPDKEMSDKADGMDAMSVIIPATGPGEAPAKSTAPGSPRKINPLHITRFKTTRDVHAQWVDDLEYNLRQLSSEVTALIKPPSSSIGMREPSFATNDTSGALSQPSSQKIQHPAIPLPDILVYQILAHVNSLRSITAAHSIHGLARVETLQPAFVQIMRDLLAARSRITAIVTAMTWPMRKKLEWLKLKYNTLLEDNALATQQVSNFKDILNRYKKDIETYKTSIAQVEKEKHSIDYRHTKILILGRHDPQVQELIVEHATDEYLQKLTEFKARETRLNGTIAQFSSEFDQLNTQGETLKAAHQSLGLIDKAQDTADAAAEARHKHDEHAGPGFGAHFGLEGMDGLSGFDQYRDGVENLNIHQAPMVPAGVSELLNAVDQFVHTTRLAEAINPKTLKDPPPKNPPNAKKVVASALAADLARHKLKNIASKVAARPKLPLFGMSAALQPRDDPTVPSKLFGFAKRIDGGLQAVSAFKSPTKPVVQAQEQTQLPPQLSQQQAHSQRAPGWPLPQLQAQGLLQPHGSPGLQSPHLPEQAITSPPQAPQVQQAPYVPYTPTTTHIEDHGLFQPSASTVFSLGSGAGTHPPGLNEMSDELSEGPHAPVRGVYTGGLGKEGDSVDMFGRKASPTLRERIGRSFLRKSSRRRNATKMGSIVDQFMLSAFGGRDFHREDLLRRVVDSHLMTPDLPDSEMTEEQRAEWRRIARLNVRGDPITVVFTKKPDLELRKTLAFMEPLQRSQPFRYDDLVEQDLRSNFTPLNIRKLIDQLREAQQKEIEARKLADPSWQPPQHGASDSNDVVADDDVEGARTGGIEFDDELDDDDFDIKETGEGDEQGGDRVLAGSVSTNKFGGGSSRDQNVGTGVTYAEYLMWKNKRKQQQQGEQQLEALKNSLNIQLRNARRVVASDVSEQTEQEAEDTVLTEQQFAELGGDNDVVKAVSEASQPSMSRDYSSTNTEVDFILSRSNSRLDAIGALKRNFSSKKRTSVGSSLHFNASALSNADGDGGSATIEAGRRARGESMMSARASLSMRARASLLVKLHRALDSMEGRSDEDAATGPGGLSRRASSRMSMVNKLSTISERSARSSLVRHGSMIKAPPVPELKLNEARDIANSIIHGKPLKEASEKKDRRGKAVDAGFDMQILEYIANDQLIMSGWESVDLFKMNDNETFSGHSFKFDDQEDKLRVSTLKEFTQSVASSAEESASAVENEFRAAIVNLNRLVGKKISDTAVLDAPPESAEAVVDAAGTEQDSRQAEGVGGRSGSQVVGTARRESHLQPHERRVSHMHSDRSATGFSRSNSAAEGDLSAGAGGAGVDGEPPHRPQEPKPSATFASPRRKIFLAEPSSLVL